MTRKTPQDIEKANKELVKTNTDIMATEAKLDKLYQQRRGVGQLPGSEQKGLSHVITITRTDLQETNSGWTCCGKEIVFRSS